MWSNNKQSRGPLQSVRSEVERRPKSDTCKYSRENVLMKGTEITVGPFCLSMINFYENKIPSHKTHSY